MNDCVEIERTYICKNDFNMEYFCENNITDKKSFDYLMDNHYMCDQYYISKTTDDEIRMRKYYFPFSDSEEFSELTIKTGQGISRYEVNEKLQLFHYEYILEAMKNKPEVKTKEIWEFTLYDGTVLFFNIVNNGALKYIDAEFPNEQLSKLFDMYKYVPKEFFKEEMDKDNPKEYIQKEGEN